MDILQIKLDACLRVYGKDFTTKSQKRHFVYARAAFYQAVYNKETSLERIGLICGGRDHCTVLFALGKAKKDGCYRLIPEFNLILHSFEIEIESLMSLKTEPEQATFTSDLMKKVTFLEEENEKLRNKLFDLKVKNKYYSEKVNNEPNDPIKVRVTKVINTLPENVLRDFERYRLLPFLKMQQSKVLN